MRDAHVHRWLFAVVVTGAIAAAIVAAGGAAGPRRDGLVPTMRFGDVVASVRRSFGDRRILSASYRGTLLTVRLDLTPHPDQAVQIKSVFEAQVLAHAVADWLRLEGRKPIAGVRYRNRRGGRILGYATDPVDPDPSVSQLRASACRSAAAPAAKRLLALVSARTLPYMHGACVFVLRTSRPHAGSRQAAAALARMAGAIGPPNERPWYFELVGPAGVPLSSAAWMPDAGGTTWARPGFAYALAHG